MHATTITVIFAILIFNLTVEARSNRHTGEDYDIDEQPNEGEHPVRLHEESSHRRKRQNGFYFRRHYQNPQDDLYDELLEQRMTQRDILRQLDEILIYVKRPPPPPPPIRYVYVRYPVPSRCNCTKEQTLPDVPSRFPEMEDVNMNWGAADLDDDYHEEANNRPLSFDSVDRSTENPVRPNNNPRRETDSSSKGRCFAAILKCCNQPTKRQQSCLADSGCQRSACTKQSYEAAVNFFVQVHLPGSD